MDGMPMTRLTSSRKGPGLYCGLGKLLKSNLLRRKPICPIFLVSRGGASGTVFARLTATNSRKASAATAEIHYEEPTGEAPFFEQEPSGPHIVTAIPGPKSKNAITELNKARLRGTSFPIVHTLFQIARDISTDVSATKLLFQILIF